MHSRFVICCSTFVYLSHLASTIVISKHLHSVIDTATVIQAGGGNNIKNHHNEGEEEVEDGIRKATFGSASACVRVREKNF
ncbi:hypothetical protein J6590_056545 [Homalodisca vitripennis]|nr:hypothetical protein J6590_056545 [Homalodisca vitripennis]